MNDNLRQKIRYADWKLLAELYAAPVIMIAVGALLLFNPDSMTALIGKVLGGALILVGIVFGVSAVVDKDKLVRKVFWALVCVLAGGWLTGNALTLAAALGRMIGIVVAIWGIHDFVEALTWKTGLLLPGVITAVGAVLVFLPLTTSRLVFRILGAVVLVLGILMLRERKTVRHNLEEAEQSHYIDAEIVE